MKDIDLIAQLVGTTNAELKRIDSQIVSASSNLQQSKDLWSPQDIVKSYATGDPVELENVPVNPLPSAPATAEQAPAPVPPASVPPASVPPSPVQGSPVTSMPVDNGRLDVIEGKLDVILGRLDDIVRLDKKISGFVDRGLQNKVKQITLKLDDAKGK